MRELWVSCLLFCFAVTSAEPTRIRMVVKEDSEVVLNCSASGSVRDQVFDWKKDDEVEVFLYSRGRTYGSGLSGQSPQFAGRVAHFPEALDLGNASIKIKKAEVRDKGIYTCTVPRSSPVLRSEISLGVECILKVRPPGEGACPKPNIRIVDGGPDQALLQCEVKGARPRPAVQWQDSSGRVLPALETESEERDGRFYVTVRAIVSRSGDYSCVVTQEDIYHQINSTTFVYIGQTPDPGSSTGVRDGVIVVLVGFIVGLLVAIAAVVFYFKFKAVKGKRAELAELAELAAASNKCNASTHALEERLSVLEQFVAGSHRSVQWSTTYSDGYRWIETPCSSQKHSLTHSLPLVPPARVAGGLEPIPAQWAEAEYTLDWTPVKRAI